MTDTIKKIISVLFVFAVLIASVSPCAYADSEIDAEKYIDSILDEEMEAAGASSVQSLLNGVYAKGAGNTSDWMVFSVLQYRGSAYSYSAYAKALAAYVKANDSYTTATADRYALMFYGLGMKSSESSFINGALRNSFGSNGIMSWIYGLHLMNNGFTTSAESASGAVKKLLSLQHDDGGWGLNTASDVDVTAMTLQALSQHKSDDSVKSAINSALGYLSESQQSDGSYMSYGDKNPESAAQVIVALTALGINPLTDSRFTKGGKSVADSMLSFRASDRGYTHKAGGTYNITATSQVLYALVSIYRYENGMGSLYKINPLAEEQTAASAAAETASYSSSGSGAAVKKASSPAVTASSAVPAATTASARVRTTAERHVFGRKAAEAAETETVTENASEPSEEESGTVPEEEAEVTFTPVTEEDDEGFTFSFGSFAADKEEDTSPSAETSSEQKRTVSPKVLIIITVWLAALAAVLVLTGLKKRKISNYVIVIAVTALLTGALAVSDIRTAGDYYKEEETSASADTITVTMSIDCKTVAGKGDEEITPSDGIILEPTEFTLSEGSTAYDCLIAASKKYKIQIDDSTATLTDHTNAYISGINYLYEFDYGELSGWMFSVNGTFGDVGCGSCTLSDGDVIRWQYTENLGEDLGASVQ